MSLFVEEKSASTVPPLAEDTYPAVCFTMVDLGHQYGEVSKSSNPNVVIGWEIIGETITIDGKEQPRTFYNTYTRSLNKKSKLRSDLTSWRGKEFTVEELKRFNLENVVGASCMLQIVHKKSADGSRVYANLASVTKVPKIVKPFKGTLSPVVFDIDENDLSMVDELPKWIGDKIKASPEYQMRIQRENAEPMKTPVLEELDDLDGTLPF